MIRLLNQPKNQRPNIKLYPNHFTYHSEGGRVWNSTRMGQAIKHGRWYKQK